MTESSAIFTARLFLALGPKETGAGKSQCKIPQSEPNAKVPSPELSHKTLAPAPGANAQRWEATPLGSETRKHAELSPERNVWRGN